MQCSCIDAVILHTVSDPVKPDRRAQRRAETERRLVAAASGLFVERGYAATTLADVAERADIASRTLYLHFATKAELLRRCIGVAIVGDAEPTPLADRPAMDLAMSGSTLDERIEHMAALTASLMAQAGPLLEVAIQAAPSEPLIAEAAAAGRADTMRALREFWRRIDDDGLLPPSVDLEWLRETTTVLALPETYLLIQKLQESTGWAGGTYRDWLITTWRRLAGAASSASTADGSSPSSSS
jgi:AcrR family transcriptional regulator